MHRHRTFASLSRLSAAVVGAAAVAACSGGSSSTPQPAAFSTLATATDQTCVTPSTSAQSVTLPATGGVTATISFGAYAAGATGCDPVTISTGADAEIVESSAQRFSSGRGRDATTSGKPLLTLTVGEGFGSSGAFGPFGYPTIISGMQLSTPSNLNFPDGTYYGSVVVNGQTFVIPFTASGGTLSVSASSAGSLPIIIVANATAVITIYPRGVMPPATIPTPAPSPSVTATTVPSASPPASPAPSPSGSASATATPTARPTATATGSSTPSSPTPSPGPTNADCPPSETVCYGDTPPAAVGAVLGNYSVTFANPNCTPPQGVPSCNKTGVALTQAANDGYTGTANPFAEVEYPFYGTITYTFNNTPKFLSYTLVGCPADWTFSITADLSSGVITVPASDPATYNSGGNPNGCYIYYSTIPPGVSPTPPFQSYYEILTINPVQPA